MNDRDFDDSHPDDLFFHQVWDSESELNYLEEFGPEYDPDEIEETELGRGFQDALLDDARARLAAARERWEMSPRFETIFPSDFSGYSITRLHDALQEIALNDYRFMSDNTDVSLLLDQVLAMSGFVLAEKLGVAAAGVYLRRLGRLLFRDCDLDEFVATVMAGHEIRAQKPMTVDELQRRRESRKRFDLASQETD